MSRFDCDDDGEGVPHGLWDTMVSNALAGKRGQAALAELEFALIELPEKRLISGHLAGENTVCTVGAYVAAKRAQRDGIDLATSVQQMVEAVPCGCGHDKAKHDEQGCHDTRRFWQSDGDEECTCDSYQPEHEYAHDTAQEGTAFGLRWTVAWHLAYLNDEKFYNLSPEQRYQEVLAWVRRAQGKA